MPAYCAAGGGGGVTEGSGGRAGETGREGAVSRPYTATTGSALPAQGRGAAVLPAGQQISGSPYSQGQGPAGIAFLLLPIPGCS